MTALGCNERIKILKSHYQRACRRGRYEEDAMPLRSSRRSS
ncbi:hypothetical protein HMPREF1549_01374 [Actinomyces johnsonii F0510]|uniref:Uncharacterized protein n=1 Tax=Actinomyces johnsonii F0510 TaxID=1227262 RepID=U1RJM0_9ACTO|nr:hypothetical protein HMPREF1549_01374 [Actinomyces johnsonii F0510]